MCIRDRLIGVGNNDYFVLMPDSLVGIFKIKKIIEKKNNYQKIENKLIKRSIYFIDLECVNIYNDTCPDFIRLLSIKPLDKISNKKLRKIKIGEEYQMKIFSFFKADCCIMTVSYTHLDVYKRQEYQENLIKKWDSGDHSGLAVRPASTSAHSSGFALDFNVKEVFGLTSSNINTETNKELVKELTDFAAEYGFSYGGNYKKPDPPHFYINESDYGYENRNEAIEVNDQYLKNHTEDNIPYYNPNKNENNNKKNE